MPQTPLTIEVPHPPEVVFNALIDPRYMRGYLYGTEEIAEISGPLSEAGTTFAQRAGMRVQRSGGVVSARRPDFLHLRLVGFGERADLEFTVHPTNSGSLIELLADVRNGPPLLGRVVDRLTARIEERLWRGALERLRDDLAVSTMTPDVGALYALEGGGRYRTGHVIAADGSHVHLSLRPGWSDHPPVAIDHIPLRTRRLGSHLDLRPLDPAFRTNTMMRSRGSNALMADGGFGLAHMPLTMGEFHASNPRPLGAEPVGEHARELVAAWRERGASAFGDARPPTVGGLFSVSLQAIGIDGLGFAIVKLLRQQLRGVHVRLYSATYPERPSEVDEASLEPEAVELPATIDGLPTKAVAIAHLPLGHATFQAWQPTFIATALVDPEELTGYGAWKLSRGGFF